MDQGPPHRARGGAGSVGVGLERVELPVVGAPTELVRPEVAPRVQLHAQQPYDRESRTATRPSRSATVTVSAEWPLRRSNVGTFSRKWMHTPASALVPNVSPSSFSERRAPAAVHQR